MHGIIMCVGVGTWNIRHHDVCVGVCAPHYYKCALLTTHTLAYPRSHNLTSGFSGVPANNVFSNLMSRHAIPCQGCAWMMRGDVCFWDCVCNEGVHKHDQVCTPGNTLVPFCACNPQQ